MQAQRARLLEALSHEIRDARVLEAMARVPREHFVAEELQHLAYEDIPLPIGEGQTISQPFIVALMTQELELTGEEAVLEIGTGSGYQAALLAELARRVVTVERIPRLMEAAQERLVQSGYANVEVHLAAEDVLGWPAAAPYHAIIVTAAAPRVPAELLDQLRDGGRMVLPVGSRTEQELRQVRKEGGHLSERLITHCRFVLLTGPSGWPEPDNTL